MFDTNVHWLAVIVATAAAMGIGAAWYGVLAKQWAAAVGGNVEEMRGATPGYVVAAVSALVRAYVLAVFIKTLGAFNAAEGVGIAIIVWAAFVVTFAAVTYMFSKRPLKLFLIDAGHELVLYVVIGAILGGWQ